MLALGLIENEGGVPVVRNGTYEIYQFVHRVIFDRAFGDLKRPEFRDGRVCFEEIYFGQMGSLQMGENSSPPYSRRAKELYSLYRNFLWHGETKKSLPKCFVDKKVGTEEKRKLRVFILNRKERRVIKNAEALQEDLRKLGNVEYVKVYYSEGNSISDQMENAASANVFIGAAGGQLTFFLSHLS